MPRGGFAECRRAVRPQHGEENIERRLGNHRRELLEGMAKAVKDNDSAAQDRILSRIAEFNEKPINAARIITPASIRSSTKTRNRLSDIAESGVIIQNRRLNDLSNEQLPKRVY